MALKIRTEKKKKKLEMKCDGLVTEETNARMNFETATTAAPASIFWVFFLFFFFYLFIYLFIL